MGSSYRIKFPAIQDNYNGYEYLGKLSLELKKLSQNDTHLIFDMTNCGWISANLFSVIGALCCEYRLNTQGIYISFENIPGDIKAIMMRNNFGLLFGQLCIPSSSTDTTIDYKEFNRGSRKEFTQYFKDNVLSRQSMPRISTELECRIVEDVSEMYNNFEDHAETDKVFTCGQYFPKIKQLAFTIVDTGATIPHNVTSYLNSHNLDLPKSCIEWALIEGNTTKPNMQYPRGLGLSIMKQFLAQNNGQIKILSGYEFYEISNGKEIAKCVSCNFGGTIITLTFNLSDEKAYFLSSEIPENWF